MLRDRVPSWALEVCCPGGGSVPLSPLLFWRQPGAMFLGDRRSPVPHCPCSSWVQSNHKPQPFPTTCMRRCIRCPGFLPMAIDVAMVLAMRLKTKQDRSPPGWGLTWCSRV